MITDIDYQEPFCPRIRIISTKKINNRMSNVALFVPVKQIKNKLNMPTVILPYLCHIEPYSLRKMIKSNYL